MTLSSNTKASARLRHEEQFEWWITSLPDRVQAPREAVPPEIATTLDMSVASLYRLEAYLLQTQSEDHLQSESGSVLLGQLASYIGQVIKENVPAARWPHRAG